MVTNKKDVVLVNDGEAVRRDIDFFSGRYNNFNHRVFSYNLNKMEEEDFCIITNERLLPIVNIEDNRATEGAALFFVNTPEYSMDKVRAAGYKVVYCVDKADYIVFSNDNYEKKISFKNCFDVYLDLENNAAYNNLQDSTHIKYRCYYAKNCKPELNSTVRAIINNDSDRIVLSENLNLTVNEPTEDTFMTIIGALKSRASSDDVSTLVNAFAATNWRKFILSSYVLQAYLNSYMNKRVSDFHLTKDAKEFINAEISVYIINTIWDDILICQKIYREMNNLTETEYEYFDFRDLTYLSERLLRAISPYCFNCSVQITNK